MRFFKYSCSVSETKRKRAGRANSAQATKRELPRPFKSPWHIKAPRGWIACNWFSAIEYFDDEARIEVANHTRRLTPYYKSKKEFYDVLIEQVKRTQRLT